MNAYICRVNRRRSKKATTDLENTALHAAAQLGHNAIVVKLLAAGADVNALSNGSDGFPDTPLVCAVVRGNVEVVETLLAAGADVEKFAPNHVESHGKMNPLYLAAYEGHKEICRRLLRAGAQLWVRSRLRIPENLRVNVAAYTVRG